MLRWGAISSAEGRVNALLTSMLPFVRMRGALQRYREDVKYVVVYRNPEEASEYPPSLPSICSRALMGCFAPLQSGCFVLSSSRPP